jgi:hypothetical protein
VADGNPQLTVAFEVLKFLLMDAAVEELLKKLDRWDVHPSWEVVYKCL